MHRIVNQYNAFKLNEYQGIFEVVSGNVNDDKFWMDWAIASEYDSEAGGSIPAKKDNGSYRNVPVKVVLGNREDAIANLKWLLAQLEQKSDPGEPSIPEPEPPPNDDVPF
jgi:hypothetical protein